MMAYPIWIPLLSVLLSLAIYTFGAIILSGFGGLVVIAYLLFCLWFESRVISKSCRYCYYYGRLCGPGKGLIAPLFVKQGDPRMFTTRELGCPAQKLFGKSQKNETLYPR